MTDNYDSIEITKKRTPNYPGRDYRPSQLSKYSSVESVAHPSVGHPKYSHEERIMLLRIPTRKEELSAMLSGRNLSTVEAELRDMRSCFEFYLNKNNRDLLAGLKLSLKTYKDNLDLYEANPHNLVSEELVEAVPRLRAELSELEQKVEAGAASVGKRKLERLYPISNRQNAKPGVYRKRAK